MLVPFAARRGKEAVGSDEEDAGKTDTSAPVSTKKGRLSLLQYTDNEPAGTALTVLMVRGTPVTASRLWSFPEAGDGALALDAPSSSYGNWQDPNT